MSYDGLDVQITTNTTDLLGAALTATGVTIPAFDSIIKKIRLQGGNKLDGIYLSFGLQAVVNQIVATAARYFINVEQAGTFYAGEHIVQYQSPLGPVPVIGDFFVNPVLPYPWNAVGSSGVSGATISSVYFLRHDEQGIQTVDLVPLGRTELAKMADTVRFYINEYLVLALKAEPWVGVLKNVADPA